MPGTHESNHKDPKALVNLVGHRDRQQMRGNHAENEEEGSERPTLFGILEEVASSWHFILSMKEGHGNFQMRYYCVFIMKKLFWLL